jgi:maleylacetate reductase
MKPFVYDLLPGRIVFGVGARRQVGDEMANLGLHRVAVVADASAKDTADEVAEALGERCAGVLTDVAQHVPEELAAEARKAVSALGADGVLTIGGGSATGLGKAVVVEAGLSLLAMPTTFAGSEMTTIYGLTGTHKVTKRDPRVLPRVVVYDPELTLTLPASLVGPSGFNALAHCVEAFYGPAANPVIDLLAEEGLRRLARALPVICAEPDLDGHSDALYGACLAGAALAVAGTGLHHKLCHVLGGMFRLPHAQTHSVVLPYVVAFYEATLPDVMGRIAAALGAPAGSSASEALFTLAGKCAVPTSLESLGMPVAGITAAADQALAELDATGAGVDRESLITLLDDAYHGSGA